MLKVAITGNIASGKSSVEKVLKDKGFNVLDTDDVSHDLLKNEIAKQKIIDVFEGFDIVENGELSRPKLGQIVFQDADYRKKLENILYPIIKDEIGKFFEVCEKENDSLAFVSAPLLFEAKFDSLFDKIIFVFADDEKRLERLMKRNDFPYEYAKNRLEIQMSQEKKVPLCDFVIYNNDGIDSIEGKVEKVLEKLV